MRLTLDLDAEVHRKIKTLAAFHGQSVKAFILTKLGFDGVSASEETSSEAESKNRLKFDTIEDVKRALEI